MNYRRTAIDKLFYQVIHVWKRKLSHRGIVVNIRYIKQLNVIVWNKYWLMVIFNTSYQCFGENIEFFDDNVAEVD